MTEDNSLSQQEAIAQLKQTIAQLETVVRQLDKTSAIDLPSSNSIQDLNATATRLKSLIARQTALKAESAAENEVTKPAPQTSETVSELLLDEEATPAIETIIIEPATVKSQVKANQATTAEKTSPPTPIKSPSAATPPTPAKPPRKWLIPGIIALVAAIAIPLAWYLFPSSQPDLLVTRDPDLDLPVVETPIVPEDNITTTESTPETATQEESEITIPSELTAQSRPKKVAVETIPPQLKLSPEQNFIAALNSKITALEKSQNDLVVAIKPDLDNDVVTVTLADDWYQLPSLRQDKLLSEMFKRSRQLQFAKLKIKDSQQTLIARSPVVGKEMVVLRRTN